MTSRPFWIRRLLYSFPLLFALFISAGCERASVPVSTPSTEKEREAIQIAADFAQDGDLARARTRLNALDVPKAEQWLAVLAERYISEGKDATTTDHLVALTLALEVKTASIVRYARARFTPTPVPTKVLMVEPAVTFTPEPSPLATVEAPEPAPTSTPTPTPTVTSVPTPFAIVQAEVLNVRAGPGTSYPVVGRLTDGESVNIIGQSVDGAWWQVCCVDQKQGWVSGALVEAQGRLGDVPVITDVPPPPPTPTPRPPTPTPVPQASVDFRVVSTRMLSIQENGGCVGMHNIFVTVLDAAGAPLDGVRVGRVWVPEDIKVTGADNKGPGRAEFDLFKHGDQVRVLDGSSETTRPLEVEDEKIPIPELIAAGYCPDETECRRLIDENRLCRFHYSWEVVFQRTW